MVSKSGFDLSLLGPGYSLLSTTFACSTYQSWDIRDMIGPRGHREDAAQEVERKCLR